MSATNRIMVTIRRDAPEGTEASLQSELLSELTCTAETMNVPVRFEAGDITINRGSECRVYATIVPTACTSWFDLVRSTISVAFCHVNNELALGASAIHISQAMDQVGPVSSQYE